MCGDRLAELRRKVSLILGRERTCGGRKDYERENVAAVVARQNTKSGRAVEEAYQCPFCDGWHIGRKYTEEEMEEIILQAKRLRADRLRDLVVKAKQALVTMDHAKLFTVTREKMHPTGVELYDKTVKELACAISEIDGIDLEII